MTQFPTNAASKRRSPGSKHPSQPNLPHLKATPTTFRSGIFPCWWPTISWQICVSTVILVALAQHPGFAQTDSFLPGEVLLSDASTKFLTGKKLDRRNERPISVWWRDAQLKSRLKTFAANESIAVKIDRRVDPNQVINAGVDNRSIQQFFWDVGHRINGAVCRIEDCYYFGPLETVMWLPIEHKKIAASTSARRKRSKVKWTSKRVLVTAPVVEPKSLLLALGRRYGFEIKEIDQIPHDVWQGFELPPTSLQTQVLLILAGFDKTFRVLGDGTTIKIVDFEPTDSAKREFVVSANFDGTDEIKAAFPNLRIRTRSKRIIATGPPQDLQKLESAIVQASTPETAQDQVLSLKTDADRLTILRTIAQRTGLELIITDGTESLLAERVSLDEVRVTRDELIFSVLQGTQLRGTVAQQQLTIDFGE